MSQAGIEGCEISTGGPKPPPVAPWPYAESNSVTHFSQSELATAMAFAKAINRQNVPEMLELMTDDHTLVDSLGSRFVGKQNMAKAWEGYFRMVPDYSITVEENLVQGSTVVMLGTAQGTYGPDGKLLPENRWSTPAAWRVEIKDRLVSEWRVYADNEPIRKIMGRKPSHPKPAG
jgi:ketosteroid isomerase-like protein